MPVRVIDLGRMDYQRALEQQQDHHAQVLASRESAGAGDAGPRAELGRLLLVEHEPVITITPKPSASAHLLATPELLARAGVTVAHTDRGGDITYHGPGQLVVYPILDLNAFGLRLHDYMRLLESVVIDALAEFGVLGVRDTSATGVWVARSEPPTPEAKICAMGVRIRRWVSLHGLALNVDPDMSHFRLIVPCGLIGRPVTSVRQELGVACPSMDVVKSVVSRVLVERLTQCALTRAERGASEPGQAV